jgi:hypothetical protein
MARWRKPELPHIKSGVRGNADFRQMWMAKYGFGPSTRQSVANDQTQSTNWDNTMARKTYRIELKIDFNDDTRHEALLQVAKQYARDFLASAMLLQDGRKPMAVLHTDDTFTGVEEIGIMDPSDDVHQP